MTQAYVPLRGLKPAEVLGAGKPHGTRLRYMGGCRCLPCRGANATYETDRARARRYGFSNKYVSAAKAKRHLLWLSARGLGRRAVARQSGVAESSLGAIRAGAKLTIREQTEKKILAVTATQPLPGSYIDAAPTWRQIDELLSEGFSKASLARRLGLGERSLQLGKKQITARNAKRVDRLYRRLMAI